LFYAGRKEKGRDLFDRPIAAEEERFRSTGLSCVSQQWRNIFNYFAVTPASKQKAKIRVMNAGLTLVVIV